MTEANNRIKLSWDQVAWGLAILIGMGSAWYDMRSQIAALRSEIALVRAELVIRVQRTDQRLDRLESRGP